MHGEISKFSGRMYCRALAYRFDPLFPALLSSGPAPDRHDVHASVRAQFRRAIVDRIAA
jgi:hypothetical protein